MAVIISLTPVFQGSASPKVAIGKRHGHFLFFAYLFVKALYIANAILLLFLLNTIVGKQNSCSPWWLYLRPGDITLHILWD